MCLQTTLHHLFIVCSLCVIDVISADSKHDEWQAMEGTGVVAFHENHMQRAEKYFTKALETLKASPEINLVSCDRIAGKLRDVQTYLTMQQSIHAGNRTEVELFIFKSHMSYLYAWTY